MSLSSSSKPFRMNRYRISKCPMKTIEKVKEILKKYHRGESIGFSYMSSLKSLGLIPRSDGIYRVSSKYL